MMNMQLELLRQEWVSKGKKIKLNLGAGNRRFSDYINIDKYVNGNDIKTDCINLDINDNSVDEILVLHMLEHLSKKEGEEALKNWYQKLKSGGKLHLELPNMNLCVKLFITSKNPYKNWIWNIYGNQKHEGEFHKFGYTSSYLKDLLKKTGFDKIRSINSPQWKVFAMTNMGMVAYK